MTIRYVGSGGSDSNDGLSWANRKLTLNGVEDTPVVAGDTVYVGPGVYREQLTCDVAGSSGSPITYIGDVTGEHTDGVGGIVRATGSNNDQTATRGGVISGSSKNYRTVRGFSFDTSTGQGVGFASCSNLIIEDCSFLNCSATGGGQIDISGTGTNITVRRCITLGLGYGFLITHSTTHDNSNILIENCMIMSGSSAYGLRVDRVGGIVVRNCFVTQCGSGFRIINAMSGGQTLTVNNCIFIACGTALSALATGEIISDYNTFYNNSNDYANVTPGSNDKTYTALLNPPLLLDGFKFPWMFGELSKWSQVARIANASGVTEDLFGIARPATNSKKSYGAIQATGAIRETTTKQGSSVASVKLPDAGEQFLMRVPVSNESTTISIYCYRETNYAGTLPQMIIRQPGQSDRTTTDTGSASTWNQLTDTFTPAAIPPYVDVFVKSNNTATSGDYDVFFDTMAVN